MAGARPAAIIPVLCCAKCGRANLLSALCLNEAVERIVGVFLGRAYNGIIEEQGLLKCN